jgi:hypothetical protein
MHGKCHMLHDDELICSKHIQDSIIEINRGNKMCILLVLLTYTCTLHDAQF